MHWSMSLWPLPGPRIVRCAGSLAGKKIFTRLYPREVRKSPSYQGFFPISGRIFVLTQESWFDTTFRITYLPLPGLRRFGRGRIVCCMVTAMVAGLLGAAYLRGDEPSDLAERELKRRAEATQQAQESLLAGDKAYRLADYETAVASYTTAFDLFPGGAGTAQLKAAAAERLAQASVERARELARVGDYAKADELLDNVLKPGVAPHYAAAEQARAELQDPIRNNPALSPAHTRKVDEVRRLLYEANGFTELGQFDRALIMYDAVLRLDPTNSAARRGMEEVHQHKREYFAAARGETRARMLSEVEKEWEQEVPPAVLDLAEGNFGRLRGTGLFGASASEKLESIIVPVVDMDQVQLGEAIDYLRQQSAILDIQERDLERKGVAFVIELGNADVARARQIETTTFNLKLRNVPMRTVLDYILQATRTQARVDEHAVVIRPAGVTSDEIIFRQYQMPPDFLSREDLGEGGGGEALDPFAPEGEARRGLVQRLTAQEYLRKKGVDFPPGSSAIYTPQSSVLSVKNTQTNIALVEAIVEAIVEAEPVMITVEARILRSTEKRLEELGFDWIMNGSQDLGADWFFDGGTVGTGTPIVSAPFSAATAGNRSGNLATEKNSIDAALARSPVDNAFFRAPGSLFTFGTINNATVGMLMRGASQNTGLDLMTKKTVITRSGQSATIESTRDFIYPTEYEPPELPNQVGGNALIDLATGQVGQNTPTTPVTPAHPTAFETTQIGCMLEVLPQLGEDGVVEVAIKPEIRDFDGFINYGTPIRGGSTQAAFGAAGGVLTSSTFGVITENAILMPVFSTIRGNSTLSIYNGQTVVLGGLLNSSRIKVEDSTPLLSKIPLFGQLFTSQADTPVKDAYIIMVTVRLQDPTGQPVSR